MSDTDLLFRQLPLGSGELVFGEADLLSDVDVTINAQFPFAVAVALGPTYDVSATVAFPALVVAVDADYDVYVDRPLVSTTVSRFQGAENAQQGIESRHREGLVTNAGSASYWTAAGLLRAGIGVRTQAAVSRYAPPLSSSFRPALRLAPTETQAPHRDTLRDARPSTASAFKRGVPLRAGRLTHWQDRYRDRRPQRESRWGEGRGLITDRASRFGVGRPVSEDWASAWRPAVQPAAGLLQPPVPVNPCYIPSSELVFWEPYSGLPRLLFWCERHDPVPPWETANEALVVVPVRSVYVVINNVTLRRASDNLVLPTYGMSLSIDVDSWTWGFSASLWASALDDVMPSPSPVEVEASINGHPYRFIVESISRERQFGTSTIRIAGRGKSALLASPYSPSLSFLNTQQRTAQQLMEDVLTENNIPMGWDIDWQLTDWLVPAGVFAVQGSHMDGLLAVANAAGAYLQPHPTLQQISVLHRYPTAPWLWNTVTPDFELPSAVTTREGIEWIEKPAYNRVFVSGTSAGVIGQVTITGSGGTLAAPMVTDPLITQAAAARQRGIAVLGDTGKQARVSLRLPVLDETGIIMPGKFVSYVDSEATRLGLVRSTTVEAGFPDVFQSLIVETHL